MLLKKNKKENKNKKIWHKIDTILLEQEAIDQTHQSEIKNNHQ
jgi:hypothetical protein